LLNTKTTTIIAQVTHSEQDSKGQSMALALTPALDNTNITVCF